MHQPRTNLGNVLTLNWIHRPTRSPEPVTTPSNSPLDALVRGLASIGERFFKGEPKLRA
jgi:hypothetical protein